MTQHPSIREVCHHRDCYLEVEELGVCSKHYELGTQRLLEAIRNIRTAP